MRRSANDRNFAFFLNIAHLHFRVARQAGETDGQLSLTTNSHAAGAVATDFFVLRRREPGGCLRNDDAKDGTAHVLFVGVGLAGNIIFPATLGHYARNGAKSSAFLYPPGGIDDILPRG